MEVYVGSTFFFQGVYKAAAAEYTGQKKKVLPSAFAIQKSQTKNYNKN